MMSSTIARIAHAGRGEQPSPSKPSSIGDFDFLREESDSRQPHKLASGGATPSPATNLSQPDLQEPSGVGRSNDRFLGRGSVSRLVKGPEMQTHSCAMGHLCAGFNSLPDRQ